MFDIEALKSTITQALTALYDEDYPPVKESIESYVEKLEERLGAVAAAAATGNVDVEFVAGRMKDELLLLQSELIALKLLGVDVIQDAIAKAIEEALKLISA